MNTRQIIKWILSLSLVAAVAIGGYLFLNETGVLAQESVQSTEQTTGAATAGTVAVQPAGAALGSVSASGTIELVSQRAVSLDVSGVAKDVLVEAGDTVEVGDTLLLLETTDLERAVLRAELSVRSIRNEIDQQTETGTAAEIAVAEAALAEAEENLADLLDGADAAEIAAAQSSLAAAWSQYNELLAGPSDSELIQLSAAMEKARISLEEAQRGYDQIAWRSDAGTTSQASTLQSATIDFESAQAAYEEATAAESDSTIQSALSSAQNAQVQLNALLDSASAAEIATAEAQVAEAQENLDALITGPDTAELLSLEISLEQALLDLEEAYSDLDAATVVAPVAGMVMTIDAESGQRYSEGGVVATLADTRQLELTIEVAEVDIADVAVGQQATVEIDALAGEIYSGVVASIAPASDTSSSVVSFPVTIRLDDESLDGVLPGMTAVATITEESDTEGGWLVPTNAIREQSDVSVVAVVAGDSIAMVEVIPGDVRGEWTVVQSAELSAGDRVVGSVTSYVSDEAESTQPGGPPDGGALGGGVPGQRP